MNENQFEKQQGQSIVLIAVALIVLLIFAAIAVDLANGYVHRRTDQNAADAASLAGARELASYLNANDGTLQGTFLPESPLKAAMNDFAERNGAEDSDGIPANSVNTNVTGYYLGEDGTRLSQGGTDIVIGAAGAIPWQARGVEAVVQSVAPSFFSGVMGLDGINIDAEAAVLIQGGVCTAGCLAPIATLTTTFEFGECYNIFDGPHAGANDKGGSEGGKACSEDNSVFCSDDSDCDLGACKANGRCTADSQVYCSVDADCDLGTCEEVGGGLPGGSGGAGGFGWLNWSWQGEGHSCKDIGLPDDCSAVCTDYNLTPLTCLSGPVNVGDWVASTAGLMTTPPKLGAGLDAYIDGEIPMTVIIYDIYEGTGCGKLHGNNPGGLAYHVVGFAKFLIKEYRLPRGNGAVYRDDPNFDAEECIDWGEEGNRITGVFLEWVEGSGGDCNYFGVSGTTVVK